MATAVQSVEAPSVAKLSVKALDELCDRRATLTEELKKLNATLQDQVQNHGFTPPRANKSKRLQGERWQMTVTIGTSTEIRDNVVEVIERACPAALFEKLFQKVTSYKLVAGATQLLAAPKLPEGAPKNLRTSFFKAVQTEPKAPSLSVKRIGEEACEPGGDL